MQLNRKFLILAVVAFVYVCAFWLADVVRIAAQTAIGPKPYEGLWLFLPHLLLYTTFTAAVAGGCWFALVKTGDVPGDWFRPTRAAALWGVIGGVLSTAACMAFLHFAGMGAPAWNGFNGWEIAGNTFSNFYEELIYRGFLLAALTVVIGFWPAAIVTSITFGLTHDQYPYALQGLIAVTSVGWCWIVRRSKSLWAAWIAHMILDVAISAAWGLG
ncbi:hypothetical protein GCM10009422_20480 [Brevundimonas kwangchunensis]|uniref:CAAX prenyl protease 2/Lysostaphin resistance protein A-like domain-containing protein n=1 Tax=Brevundimonas kwangchunensis TaxID=322163 RepID=A0ABP3S3F1_9CAUL